MNPLTFSLLGGAACALLTYVLVQFNRVLLHARRSSGGEPSLTAANSRCIESALRLEKMSCPGSGEQQPEDKAAKRKEILTCAILGVVGLLAPFFFVMLLTRLWPQ